VFVRVYTYHWNQKCVTAASGMVNVRIGNKEMVSIIHVGIIGIKMLENLL